MIRKALVLLALSLLFGMPGPANAQAGVGVPLFKLIDNPTFKNSFDAMFKGEANVDNWLKRYTVDKNGPATPAKAYVVEGRSRIGGFVCLTHNCGENQFYYLFSDNGSSAVGLLIKGNAQRWFGAPSAAEKATLVQMSKSKS